MKYPKISHLPAFISIVTILATACAPTPTQTAVPSQIPSLTAMAPVATSTASVRGASASGSGMTYVLVPSKSEASYAVREQLASLSFPSDAIGKTSAISGSVTLKSDGTIDSANSKFVVDVSTLKTDQPMRDGYVARVVLQTNRYPQVVFVPTQVSGLPATLPVSGDVTFKLTGDLTIRDVTQPATWDVSGTVNNGQASGQATTSFTFEDFNLTQPRVPVVLSVTDKITLTVTLELRPAGSP
jgi:polyisoprenoid-binding protein YceI